MLNINNLSITSSDNEIILKNINYEIQDNGIYGLYGKGGTGKTTLAYSISGIIPHYLHYIKKGEIFINNIEVNKMEKNELGKYIGIVFQNPDYQLFFHRVNMELKSDKDTLKDLMNSIKIEHLLNRQIDTLSYGEKKIVILLSNILLSPKILILDEVFSSLDEYFSNLIVEFLKNWVNKKRLVIVLENEKNKLPKGLKMIDFEEILDGT
ncbi:ATP-binding cassette domain-containing protein [bacterium]|nr:ATP-binding cassette domain-containing protein [bacterium]